MWAVKLQTVYFIICLVGSAPQIAPDTHFASSRVSFEQEMGQSCQTLLITHVSDGQEPNALGLSMDERSPSDAVTWPASYVLGCTVQLTSRNVTNLDNDTSLV